MHRIDGVKRGPCLVCLEKLGDPATTTKPAETPAQQQPLFKTRRDEG